MDNYLKSLKNYGRILELSHESCLNDIVYYDKQIENCKAQMRITNEQIALNEATIAEWEKEQAATVTN
jgi:hypothetical protein